MVLWEEEQCRYKLRIFSVKKFILILFLTSSIIAHAQAVGINTTDALPPHPSALLDVRYNPSIGLQGVGMPKVYLNSITDKTIINGGNPANGLILYNTNPNLASGKGLYYWSNSKQHWSFFVNQNSISLFNNLTRYYAATHGLPVTVNAAKQGAPAYAANEDKASRNWTLIDGLKKTITIDRTKNTANIHFSGTWFATNTTAINRNVEFGYGVFVDGKLAFSRVDSKTFINDCNISTFYINSMVENLTVGNHEVEFGVIVRWISSYNDLALPKTEFPNGTQLVIGGGNAGTNCRNTSAFESRSKATIHVTQEI